MTFFYEEISKYNEQKVIFDEGRPFFEYVCFFVFRVRGSGLKVYLSFKAWVQGLGFRA